MDNDNLKLPDSEYIQKIPFASERAIHPTWIEDSHPNYTHDHGMHSELSSVRNVDFEGNIITVTTQYKIEVNGNPINIHAFVGDDGAVRCHTTPYTKYQSVIELVKELIRKFPESFTQNKVSKKNKHPDS